LRPRESRPSSAHRAPARRSATCPAAYPDRFSFSPPPKKLYSPQIVPKIAQPELRDFLATAYTPPPRRRRPPRFSILGSNAVRRSRRYLAPRLGDFAAPGKDRPARGAPRPARSRGSRDRGGDAFRLHAPGPHRGIGRAS